MKMINLYFTKEELELLEDALLTILTYNDQDRLPIKYNNEDMAIIEDARNQILEALKLEWKGEI